MIFFLAIIRTILPVFQKGLIIKPGPIIAWCFKAVNSPFNAGFSPVLRLIVITGGGTGPDGTIVIKNRAGNQNKEKGHGDKTNGGCITLLFDIFIDFNHLLNF